MGAVDAGQDASLAGIESAAPPRVGGANGNGAPSELRTWIEPGSDREAGRWLRFTEEMRGWVGFGERDYNHGATLGREAETRVSFRLTIEIADVERFAGDVQRRARAHGSITCPALGGELEVSHGLIQLLVAEGHRRTRRMRYLLHTVDGNGNPLSLDGFKVVEDNEGFDVWADTTTLFVRLYSGHLASEGERDPDAVIAAGIMRLRATDFLRQLTTMRAGGGSLRARLGTVARFNARFLSDLSTVYRGRPYARTNEDFPDLPARGPQRASGWEPLSGDLRRRIVPFTAGDGFECNLHHIRGPETPTKGPVMLVHAGSMRANMFLPPLKTTIVDALIAHGYDVWLESWRASIDLPQNHYTLDQAAVHDHPSAVAKVLEEAGADELKVIAHCMGSMSFSATVWAGLVPQVSTLIASAVSMHPIVRFQSVVKLQVVPRVASLMVSGASAQWASRASSPAAWLFKTYGRVVRRECDNGVCALGHFLAGTGPDVVFTDSAIDPEVSRWLGRELGYFPMSFYKQMAKCVREHRYVPVDDLPQLPLDLAEQPPRSDARFVLIGQELSTCFDPAGQARTFATLEAVDPGRHALHLLRGYAHADMWLTARGAREGFPMILRELERGA